MIPADNLRIYEPAHTMVRIGKQNDGGYVVADLRSLFTYDHFLSGGIANENSFEIAALEMHPSLACHAFDPMGGSGQAHPRYNFHQAKLDYTGLDTCRDALVKVDIEREEWPWLYHLPISYYRNIAQLVIELHSPHVPHESGWSWDSLEILNRTHVLIHGHANNWDGIVDAGGARVPGTFEGTWLRRDIAGELPRRRRPIPDPLDMANDPRVPDHVIDWEPFVEVVT